MNSLHERINNGEFDTKIVYSSETKKKWREDNTRLHRVVFKEALEMEFGLKNHPKADKVFAKAWDTGHSSGLVSVLYEYEELVELVL